MGDHFPGVGESEMGGIEGTAIGEGIRGHIEDAHDLRMVRKIKGGGADFPEHGLGENDGEGGIGCLEKSAGGDDWVEAGWGMQWNDRFMEMFGRCVAAYREGKFDYETGYSASELKFLESIGCQPREFFDFVEDLVDERVPSGTTALLVAAVRRDYFLVEQGGKSGGEVAGMDDLPGFGEELGGMAYLPRILKKARAKLRGELDPDVMFGCGGDRNFLGKHGDIPAADFLRHVWSAGDDDGKVLEWIGER